MSYTVDETVVANSTQTYINAGIADEVELTHRFAYSPEKNKPFLEYCYTNDLGQHVKRTEWEVGQPLPVSELTDKSIIYFENKAELFTKWDVEKAQRDKRDAITYNVESAMQHQYEMDLESQKKRIAKVAEQFVDKAELVGKFQSFAEYAEHISRTIGDKCKGVKLRVKFVYAYDGFVNTPQAVKASAPWIERVDQVPANLTQIKRLPKDVFDRPANAGDGGSRAPKTSNPLGLGGPSENEDLPF